MAKKLADDLIQSNREYTRLRADEPAGKAPRETPDHQSPGYRGLARPELDKWTTDELRRAAATLQAGGDLDDASREDLIERLLAAGHGR